ncbi:50S ribosomal protein L37ae, partial [Candidatus Micrarchaeota archaeon]|nr:50S ribosomal protein L37ae [Candidatus Micrarchaeota archaeon]
MGSHYGKKIRERVKKATAEQKKLHACPQCGKKRVKRVGFALWKCRSCAAEFAG